MNNQEYQHENTNFMRKNYTNRRYLDALEKKVLVFDGAMGTHRDESLAQCMEALWAND